MDAANRQSLPGVSVSFTGTSIGTSSDNNGHFTLSGNGTFTRITFSFIGYKPVTRNIVPGKEQVIDVALSGEGYSFLLKEVVVNPERRLNTGTREIRQWS